MKYNENFMKNARFIKSTGKIKINPVFSLKKSFKNQSFSRSLNVIKQNMDPNK